MCMSRQAGVGGFVPPLRSCCLTCLKTQDCQLQQEGVTHDADVSVNKRPLVMKLYMPLASIGIELARELKIHLARDFEVFQLVLGSA